MEKSHSICASHDLNARIVFAVFTLLFTMMHCGHLNL